MSQSMVYRNIPRPDPTLIELLRGIPVADLHDEMDPIDRRQRLMDPVMKPLLPGKAFVGPAVTAYCTPGDNLMMHAALFLAQRGDVVVVANGGVAHGAVWGGNATTQALRRGVAALVADAPVRDIAQVRAGDFGVWATIHSVTKPGKENPGYVNMPLMCAGVLVQPGDIVVGDEDGVITIDPRDAERLARAALARIERDKVMQQKIAGGSTLFEELNGFEQLKKVGARVIDGHWTSI